uniref:ABC transporter permease n=1 Tax=Agrobacterium fabrum TaxID=1176649 RepID=UPI0021BD17BA|nr:ABC transporter permease [Agrobacterium fabrum]UVY99584.1 hypothetical protein K4M20_00311 [Agrobacterium fabrum]
MNQKKLVNWGQTFLLLPVFVVLLLAFFVPLLAILPQAFGGDAVARFLKIFAGPVYLKIVWTTVRMSLEATVITLVVSFPLAWLLSRATGIKALLLGLLVLVPFLTSVLVRTFAWIAILGQRGLVNGTLLSLGLISEPLPLLFSEPAVVLALVHSSIPMMVFSLVTVLRRIDGRILLAANTLGANPLRAWLGVVIPPLHSRYPVRRNHHLPVYDRELYRSRTFGQPAATDACSGDPVRDRNRGRLGLGRSARYHACRCCHDRCCGSEHGGTSFLSLAASGATISQLSTKEWSKCRYQPAAPPDFCTGRKSNFFRDMALGHSSCSTNLPFADIGIHSASVAHTFPPFRSALQMFSFSRHRAIRCAGLKRSSVVPNGWVLRSQAFA